VELSFLDRVTLFCKSLYIHKSLEKLDKYEKLKLLDGLEVKMYNKGDFIINEGEEGDYFYIIE